MRIAETLPGGVSARIKRPIAGRFITCKEASAEVEISGVGIAPVNLGQGETYDLGGIRNGEITIRNTSASSNTFKLEITERELKKADNQSFVVNTTATIENGDDNQHLARVTIAAGATAAVASANGSRKFLRINYLGSSLVEYVTMGKTGVGATTGGALERGMVDWIETTGAMFIHNPHATESVTMYVMEVNKL